MKKSVRYTSIILIISFILIFLIVQKLYKDSSKEDVSLSNKPNTALSVDGVVVKPINFAEKINVNGTLLADESVEIKSEINGKIVSINFLEGKPVSKGQLLVSIKSDDLKAQLKKAKEKLDFLAIIEKRQRTLLAKDGISQEDYDIALNDLNTQKAEVEYLTANLVKTEIKSPFSGIAGLRNVSVGSFLTTNNVVTSIYKVDNLKLEFSFPQKYYNQVKLGDKVTFTLPPNVDIYEATIYAISPEIDPMTRSVMVRASFQNIGNKIMPGSFAEVQLNFGGSESRIMIPTQALIPDLESEKVFLYKNGKAVPVKVKTGTRTISEIEIVEGLNIEDTVIVSGIIQLRPNMDVKIDILESK